MKFLSPEVALYLYKYMTCPCMEYSSHVWAGAPSCYLELLDKLQKRICTTVGPSLAIFLEPLAHHRNVASLSLVYRYYFGTYVHLNWLNWLHFLFLVGAILVILIVCMIFLSPFLDVTKMSTSSFFPRAARLWNSVHIECFPLTNNLNGLKSRISKHLLTVGSF